MPMKTSIHIKITLLTFLLIVAVQAEIMQSWTSGATTVTFSQDGTLRISGEGATEGLPMFGFGSSDLFLPRFPWYGFAITDLLIEEGVTHIGEMVFDDLQGAYTLPNNVTVIGESAFVYCTGLTSITIPNSVIAIEKGAFGGCTNLMSISIIARGKNNEKIP